jgi:glutamine amidotransferase
MIGIIDYGMGNLGSVSNACAFLELDARIISRAEEIADCRALILPGVGAFGDCMKHLDEHGFVNPVRSWIEAGRPFLGICLGLQVLYEHSEESPGVEGLGVFRGTIRRFDLGPEWKVPQIGWNRVRPVKTECPLFAGLPEEPYFYFVHSYHAVAEGAEEVAGITDYGVEYASLVWKDHVAAVQFHPEKSQRVGLAMLRNFAEHGVRGRVSS